MQNPNGPSTPSFEYIILVALLISIGALGTDLMLPALDVIGTDLGASAANDVHYIVTAFFFGMAAGQLIAGPLSFIIRATEGLHLPVAGFCRRISSESTTKAERVSRGVRHIQ